MFGIVDVAVTLGGLVVGLIQKSMSESHEQKMLLMKANIKDVKHARGVSDDWFKWTRRMIAIIVTCYIFIAPLVAAYLEIPVNVAYVEDNGFLISWLKGDIDFVWKTLPAGLSLTPIHIYGAELVIGLYFGRK